MAYCCIINIFVQFLYGMIRSSGSHLFVVSQISCFTTAQLMCLWTPRFPVGPERRNSRQDVSGRERQSESFVALGTGRVRLFENPGRSGAEENWSLFISISFLYLAAGWQVAGRVGVRCCQVVHVGAPPDRRHTAPLLAGLAENAKYCCQCCNWRETAWMYSTHLLQLTKITATGP